MGEANFYYFTCLKYFYEKLNSYRKMASFLSFAARRHLSTTVARMGAGSGAGSGAGAGHGSMQMWKNITIFVAGPAITLAMVNAYIGKMEHWSHPRPPFVAYEHLRIRTKAFPWGDGNKTLFHHPQMNPLPEGYEDEAEGEEDDDE